jgi:Protein of unknown function (DUF2499)
MMHTVSLTSKGAVPAFRLSAARHHNPRLAHRGRRGPVHVLRRDHAPLASTVTPAAPRHSAPETAFIALSLLCVPLLLGESCSAADLAVEPSNALSLPTWAIHVSSVCEWAAAMLLFWKYAQVTKNARWKGLAVGMLPSLGGAMTACTWHFFYNSPSLYWLVSLQALLTVVGNTTCWVAAHRLRSQGEDGVQQKQ